MSTEAMPHRFFFSWLSGGRAGVLLGWKDICKSLCGGQNLKHVRDFATSRLNFALSKPGFIDKGIKLSLKQNVFLALS